MSKDVAVWLQMVLIHGGFKGLFPPIPEELLHLQSSVCPSVTGSGLGGDLHKQHPPEINIKNCKSSVQCYKQLCRKVGGKMYNCSHIYTVVH